MLLGRPAANPPNHRTDALEIHDGTIIVDGVEYDYIDGQSLSTVFGSGCALLSSSKHEVRNAAVPQSFKQGRFLRMDNHLYPITEAHARKITSKTRVTLLNKHAAWRYG